MSTEIDKPRPSPLAAMQRNTLTFIPQLKIIQLSAKNLPDGIKGGDMVYNNQINLGTEIPCWIIAMQPVAMEFKDQKLVVKTHNYETDLIEDPSCPGSMIPAIVGDEDFKRISESKDDRKTKHIFRWGVEILLYIPSRGLYCNLTLGTSSARNHIGEFEAFNKKDRIPIMLFTFIARNKKTGDEWIEPSCRTLMPDETPNNFTIPNKQGIEAALKKFLPQGEAVDGEVPPER